MKNKFIFSVLFYCVLTISYAEAIFLKCEIITQNGDSNLKSTKNMRIENGRVNLFYDSPISNSLPISVTSDEFVFNQETWSGKNVKTGENTKFFENFKINRFTGDISMSVSSFAEGRKLPETMVSYSGTCAKIDTKKF